MCFVCSAKTKLNLNSGNPLEAIGMDEVFRMYAMSDGDPYWEAG